MEAIELKCPYCGSAQIGLAELFAPYSALTDKRDVACKTCPNCHKTYELEREVYVSYVLPAQDSLPRRV